MRLDVHRENYPPVATNDNATLAEDGTLEDPRACQRHRPGWRHARAGSCRDAAERPCQVLTDGRVRYTPRADFFGSDRFSYTVADPSGAR